MGWFDNQIREKKIQKQAEMDYAYWSLASVINQKSEKTFAEEYQNTGTNALMRICDYYHVERDFLEQDANNLRQQLERLQSIGGVQSRKVSLEGKWWKDLAVPLLAKTQSGWITAILPWKDGNFYFQTESGRRVKVDNDSSKTIRQEAICFYPPLPRRSLTPKDIMLFLWKSVSKREKIKLTIISILITLIGMLTPYLSKLLFSKIIPSGQLLLVYSIAALFVGTAVSSFLLGVVKNVLMKGMEYQMQFSLSAAIYSRVLHLRTDFFKEYSAGELAERINCLDSICGILCESLLGTGLSALFSLVYLLQIFRIARELLMVSIGVLACQLLLALLSVIGRTNYIRRKLYAGTKVQGLVFSLFGGIQKIKTSGSEERGFVKWAEKYRLEAEATYNPPLYVKIGNALTPVITTLGTFFTYWVCIKKGISVSSYVAYQSTFGLASGALLQLAGMVNAISSIKPIFELATPILNAEIQEENADGKEYKLSGNVELNNVTFSYTKEGPKILDNLSLKIKRGQYVAIVGKTGCGKSTLMRLLLGFERPNTGVIYYDGVDVEKINPKSLHRQIGVVMQNGKLFNESIYSNISIATPELTMDEAWEAAEVAGLDNDIRKMPMGMHTVLGEGAGGISGGQKQRLLIARAVAAKPRLLLLDEATSALDNITQKHVSEALANMKCTRIVIAHRLSTIKECDRILVLDNGKIVEDGSYDELMDKNGFFAELVERQQLQQTG